MRGLRVVAPVCAAVLVALTLQGCGSDNDSSGGGGGGGGGTTSTGPPGPTTTTPSGPTTTTTKTTTTWTRTGEPIDHCVDYDEDTSACSSCEKGFNLVQGQCLYTCDTDLVLPVVKPESKGIALDDTTFEWCADRIPHMWPNTKEPITSMRLFSAWQAFWPDEGRNESWRKMANYIKAKGVKVLVGTQVTCNETDDDRDWEHVKVLMKSIGPEHVMGLAVGNEMELLWTKDYIKYFPKCIPDMWAGGYFWRKTVERVKDMDALGAGFSSVPITTVFGGLSLGGSPFYEDPARAMCTTYLRNATKQYGTRWAFTLNIYPYYDPGNCFDPGSSTKCSQAIERDLCLGDYKKCTLTSQVVTMRQKMHQLTGQDAHLMWIGETGWSTPMSSTLTGPMTKCADFSSRDTFLSFYKGFLGWDLSAPGGNVRPADHIFYFTIRDSLNFGMDEHFGLISACNSTQCKLQSVSDEEVELADAELVV